MSDTASELTWISNVLRDLGIPLTVTPELYCDNLSAVHLSANPAYHARTKHFETHYHYVRERVALGSLLVYHIPGHLQIADIFTKSLPYKPFCSLRFKFGVDFPPTPSLRGAISIAKTLAHPQASPSVKTKPNGVVIAKDTEMGCIERKPTTTSTLLQRSPANRVKNRVPAKQNQKDKDDMCRTKEISLSNRYELLGSDDTC